MNAMLRAVAVTAIGLLCLPGNAYADGHKEIIKEIAATTGVSDEKAIQTLNAILAFTERLQSRLSYIASSSDPLPKKDAFVRSTIQSCFDSETSPIEIAASGKGTLRVIPVNTYLHRLARLKELYGYGKVSLTFRSDYFGMGRVYSVPGKPGAYEISVSLVQLFSASRNGVTVYSDASKRKFRIALVLENETLRLAVKEAFVTESVRRAESRGSPTHAESWRDSGSGLRLLRRRSASTRFRPLALAR